MFLWRVSGRDNTWHENKEKRKRFV